MNRPASTALLASLASACTNNPPNNAPESSTSTDTPSNEVPACRAHQDCEDNELCFPDGVCSPPWGSGFDLTDFSFEGPWAAFKDSCILSSHWLLSPATGEPFHARPGRWSNPVIRPWLVAVENTTWGIAFLDSTSKNNDVACPQLEKSTPFCITPDCLPLTLSHYRGASEVVLQDGQENVFRFRLVPRGN